VQLVQVVKDHVAQGLLAVGPVQQVGDERLHPGRRPLDVAAEPRHAVVAEERAEQAVPGHEVGRPAPDGADAPPLDAGPGVRPAAARFLGVVRPRLAGVHVVVGPAVVLPGRRFIVVVRLRRRAVNLAFGFAGTGRCPFAARVLATG
jgi:hypothetical protein